MAETITIPSPSAFLRSPILPTPTNPPATTTQKQPSTGRKLNAKPSTKSNNSETTRLEGISKPKQSKSRNGCVTCKAKRLKCDETKPTCQQCARRRVTCGGYKKDFKWRPFGEQSFVSKPPLGKTKKASACAPNSASPDDVSPSQPEKPLTTDEAFTEAMLAISQPQPPPMRDDPSPTEPPILSPLRLHPPVSPTQQRPPHSAALSEYFEPDSLASSASFFNDTDTLDILDSDPSSFSSNSPPLDDLLLPGLNDPSDLGIPHTSVSDSMLQPFDPGPGLIPDEDDIEEIFRQDLGEPQPAIGPTAEQMSWIARLPSPPPSSSTSSSEGSAQIPKSDPFSLLREPHLDSASPEMTALRYDRKTCGILSVKDGPTENPWRTLIWPLAQESPALYHAIGSMTNFHMSKEQPELRVQGIEHVRCSIQALASGIEDMRLDTAIATTLALAFSESWDTHVSTGIDHIKGAKVLVHKALVKHKQSPEKGDDLARLKFLCNSWVYMDVIARLTSVEADESNDFDNVCWSLSGPAGYEELLDPLMGCASSLFPTIGRVANLARRVRRSQSNSPAIISQAMELKELLENWMPPAFFEPPEDPTSHVQHSLQTAEAYRWATLLYLHQAVPEIPSLPSAALAKKVLVYLATVPLTSRSVIVHIFPLTAAGCEAVSEEDRQWVLDRWQAMGQRMGLGIIDRCVEVVKEVWDRRDAYNAKSSPPLPYSTNALKRGMAAEEDMVDSPFGWMNLGGTGKRRAMSDAFNLPRPQRLCRPRKHSSDPMTGEVDTEFTVRGSLHWLGVMKDWCWEVLLG